MQLISNFKRFDWLTFEGEFLLLLFKRFHQFLLFTIPLLALQLLGRNRFAGARLRVGIVRRPAWALLRVLLLAPFRAPILEPNLAKFGKNSINSDIYF